MRYKTPYSRLFWSNLEEWITVAGIIRARRSSLRRNRQRAGHVAALPVKLIYECQSRKSLDFVLFLLIAHGSDFMLPCRGDRKNAPHTALIVAIKNRLAQIDRAEDLASMPDGHNSRGRHSNPPVQKTGLFSPALPGKQADF